MRFILVFLAIVAGGRALSPSLCLDRDCLWEASTILDNMNTSVDPCTDFYTHVCGNFNHLHPIPEHFSTNILSIVNEKNEEKLKKLLKSPIKDTSGDSAEQKGKEFFQSCMDEYRINIFGGLPLIGTIIKDFGQWYPLMGTFNETKWSSSQFLNEALVKSHKKFWTSPFFGIYVAPDWQNATKGQPPNVYTIKFDVYQERHKPGGYYNFLRGYLKLLWKDYATPPQSDAILQDTFRDIVYVETQILNISEHTRPIFDNPFRKLGELNQLLPGKVDWVHLVSEMFRETGVVTEDTVIDFYALPHLKLINKLINSLTPRQLNNYIIWKLAKRYVEDLSFDYVQLSRVWKKVKSGGKARFLSRQESCFETTKQYMGYLLSSLFIQENYVQDSQAQVTKIFELMTKSLIERLGNNKWMDEDTKLHAQKKLQHLVKKVGYPDWLLDSKVLNEYYNKLEIQKGAHFSNKISMAQFRIREFGLLLVNNPSDGSRWLMRIYYAYPMSDYNFIQFSAGLLQHPIFDHRVPNYINFASIGPHLGSALTSKVDLYGSAYDFRSYHHPWYSDSAKKNFDALEKCHANLYANQTFCYPSSSTTSEQICKKLPFRWAAGTYSYRNVAALNVAFEAYQSFVKDPSTVEESLLPGLGAESAEQEFFIAFAQQFCTAQDPKRAYHDYIVDVDIMPQLLVNQVLKQSPDFSKAFKCPKDSPMATGSICPGF